MSKTEIIAELAHLSPQDLAEVPAWLDRLVVDKKASPSTAHVRSPRLANPAEAKHFIKQVTELPPLRA